MVVASEVTRGKRRQSKCACMNVIYNFSYAISSSSTNRSIRIIVQMPSTRTSVDVTMYEFTIILKLPLMLSSSGAYDIILW